MDQTLHAIADFVVGTRDDDIPADVRRRARDILTDSMGCATRAWDCMGARVGLAYPAAPRGEEGTVVGSALGVPLDIAAFCNTAMIRYFDFNDTLVLGHPSDMVGALVAMARAADATGSDVLRAIVVAYEIFYRLHGEMLSMTPDRGYVVDPYTLDQGFAVAVGATGGLCSLLGMAREETAHALSFAATNGTPLRASRAGQLSHYKGTATAVSSRHAVFCVHMARSGLTAPEAPFEGRHGLMELLSGRAAPLGIEPFGTFGIMETQLKYFPVTANCQVGVWAGLALREQVDPGRLDSVTLRTSRFLKHESGSEPAKWAPTTRETADHSLPYVFACALRDGTVGVDSFHPDNLQDEETRALMSRVAVEEDPLIESEWPAVLQMRVRAVDVEGKTFDVHVADPRGTAANPMDDDDIARKFTSLTAPVLGAPQSHAAFDAVWNAADAISFGDVLDVFHRPT